MLGFSFFLIELSDTSSFIFHSFLSKTKKLFSFTDEMSGLESQLHLQHHQAKLSSGHHQIFAAGGDTTILASRSRLAAANRPAVPLPTAAGGQNLVRVSTNANDHHLVISRALSSSLSNGSAPTNASAVIGGGMVYAATNGQQPKASALIDPQHLTASQLAASNANQQRYQELLSQRLLNSGQVVRLAAKSDFTSAATVQPARPSSVQSGSGGGYRSAAGVLGVGSSSVVQTLPRSSGQQPVGNQQQHMLHQEFSNQECFFSISAIVWFRT